jgi:GNAT superfamily N-acetyltransferase
MPWLAALWVDEAFRRRGIAAALIADAARRAHTLVTLGWRVPEEDIGAHGLTLYGLELGAVPSRT